MATIDYIELEILAAIRSVPSDTLKGDRAWTKAVFKAIADLGVRTNHRICSSSSDGEHDSGWLYDLIWYKVDDQGQLLSVPLILECEWHTNYERIKYDFEKLLISRSKYKVMIFQAKGEKMEKYFQNLEAGIQAFESAAADEAYILACFDDHDWDFDIRIIKR